MKADQKIRSNFRHTVLKRFLLSSGLILAVSMGYCQDLSPGEGYVQVQGGRIWYKVIGEGDGIPLLAVHGGPGGRSCSNTETFSLMAGRRPVIIFDQLESGFSDRPGDTSLWKLPFFVKQVEAIRNALDLKAFHLLGSSWGAAVVIEYMLTQHPEEVVSVIFSGPYLSTETWMKDAKILLGGLPEEIQDTIAKYEALKNYRAPAYKAATDSFYIRYLSRTAGLRRESDYCKDAGPFNEEIYLYMWGPTEFNATGTLKNFDRIDRLHELKLPVLFIAGEYDEVRAETLFQYQELVENSKSVIIKGSGHAITADRPEEYIKVLNEFLEETEKRLPANR